jgi:hypothetical protein
MNIKAITGRRAMPHRLLVTLVGGLLALGAVDVWAAKAPLSLKELKKQASHVISGKVVQVTWENQKSKVERSLGIHRDRVYAIVLKVKTISKGTGLKAGEEVIIEAWQPALRIPPLPGLQGHESIPKKGGRVTVYLEGKRGKVYLPILPNGIVIERK